MAEIEKPESSWSTRKLRNWIKEHTKKINQTLAEYDNAVKLGVVKQNDFLEDAAHDLQAMATGRVSDKLHVKIGVTGKTKRQLLEQARGLLSFEKIDIYSPAAIRKQEQEDKIKRRSFNRNWGTNLNNQQWRTTVRVLNAVRDLLDDFGYDDVEAKGTFLEALVGAIKGGKIKPNEIINTIQKMKKEKDEGTLLLSDGKEFAKELINRLNEMAKEKK
jgi:hypothetical protein